MPERTSLPADQVVTPCFQNSKWKIFPNDAQLLLLILLMFCIDSCGLTVNSGITRKLNLH